MKKKIKNIFHSQANKTHFHKKGCAPSLILKVRVFGTRKWPISFVLFFLYALLLNEFLKKIIKLLLNNLNPRESKG